MERVLPLQLSPRLPPSPPLPLSLQPLPARKSPKDAFQFPYIFPVSELVESIALRRASIQDSISLSAILAAFRPSVHPFLLPSSPHPYPRQHIRPSAPPICPSFLSLSLVSLHVFAFRPSFLSMPSPCLPFLFFVRVLFVRLTVHLSVYLVVCLSVRLSVYLFVCLSVRLSVYLFVCLPVKTREPADRSEVLTHEGGIKTIIKTN